MPLIFDEDYNVDEDAVKAIVAPPSADLTLEGEYVDGENSAGSDVVRVIVDP